MKNLHHQPLRWATTAILCCASMGAAATDEDVKANLSKPFVTINGVVQTNGRAEVLLREQLARGVKDSRELRDGVRDVLINQSLMEQEARKQGLDQDILVQTQIDLARQGILAQAWQQKVLNELVIKDEELKAEYDSQIARLGDQEYQLRHILVNDESTAKLLIEKLQSGSKVMDLAREYSRDTATREQGGLTGWTSPANLLPPVAEALKKLTRGKFTQQAVQTDLGWHILQLEDTRPFKAPTLETLKPQLNQIIARRTLDARLKALKDHAKIQ